MNIALAKNLLQKFDRVLEIILVVGVFCLIFTLAHRAIFDLDIWLHLKAGEFIAQNKTVPSQDIFSFTMPGRPWVDHSWLFQWLSYSAYSKWQADGLIFLASLLVLLSFLVLFIMGHNLAGSYLEVGLFTIIAAYASISRFNIRPDIFSYLFFALYLYILRLHIDKRAIWLLVPLQVLWVNFHGYFFLGPLLVFFFIAAEFFRRRFKFLPRQWKKEFALSEITYGRLKKLLFVLVLACLLNPNGLKGAIYPLYIFKEAVSGRLHIFLKYIQELQPTLAPGKSPGKFYYMLLFFCASLMAINFRRLKIIEPMLFFFFFFFSLSLRNIVFFNFICSMIIFSYVGLAFKKVSANMQLQRPFRQALYCLFRCEAAIVFMVWLGFKMDGALTQTYYDFKSQEVKSSLIGIDNRNYPEGAADFVLQNDLPARMFNDFNSGAYLIGRVFPKRQVFIDGRTELYGPEFFKQYMDMLKGDISSFENIIDKYQVDAMLFSMALNNLPDIAGYLYQSPSWKPVFLDQAGVIFLKDTPANKGLLKKYKIDLKNYAVPRIDLAGLRLKAIYPLPYIKRASLFNLFKEDELVIRECREALRIMPHCAEAFHLLGKVYLRKGSYQEAFQNLRSALLFLPGNVEALADLSTCYQELKETKLALNALKRAIKINRRYAPAYYRLGCLYLAMQDEKEAVKSLTRAVRYAPEEPRYHYKLAEVLLEKGKELKKPSYVTEGKVHLGQAQELNNRFQDKELKKQIEARLKEIK